MENNMSHQSPIWLRLNHPSNGWSRFVAAILGGVLLGAAVAALGPGSFWIGWLAASILCALALFFLLSAWTWAGGNRLLGWMVALAFLLRLVLGIGLSLAIAEWGYDNDCQNAGYLFKDACMRAREAFSIAQKNEDLFWFSDVELDNDQYGGLAYLSGWIYRFLSPDAHRSFLILIVGAFFAALGVPFLGQALRMYWSDRVANLAAWIFVLYPDALFFGSSQMREPIIVGLSAIAFYAVLIWDCNKRTSLLILAASLLTMFGFSTRVALIFAAFLGVLWWWNFISARSGVLARSLGWLGSGVGLVALVLFSLSWFNSSAGWDILQTIRSSGSLSTRVKEIGEQWSFLFTVAYGLVRPFLPAAIADSDSLPLLRVIGIIRSLGWYMLAPFLVYGVFNLWRESDKTRRRLAIWLIFTVISWLLISSARGGGDATDNPRYRSLMIIWIGLMAAWALEWALTHRDAWLWRWIAVEVIFLGFFTHWYISRYYRLWARIEFWDMMTWIGGLSCLILVGGWLYDRFHSAGRSDAGK